MLIRKKGENYHSLAFRLPFSMESTYELAGCAAWRIIFRPTKLFYFILVFYKLGKYLTGLVKMHSFKKLLFSFTSKVKENAATTK